MSEKGIKIYIYDLDISDKAKGILIRNNIMTLDNLLKCEMIKLSSLRGISEDILSELKKVIVSAEDITAAFMQRKEIIEKILPSVQDIPIGNLNLSTRSHNALTRAGIATVGTMIQMSQKDIYELRGVGNQSVEEITSVINTFLEYDKKSTEHSISNQSFASDTIVDFNNPPFNESILSRPVTDLHLPVRVFNALRYKGIKTIRQALALSPEDILQMRNLGILSAQQLKEQIELLCETGEDYFSIHITGEDNERESPKYSKREVDIATVNKLLDDYRFKTKWLCEWYGLSRQRIYQKIEKRRKNYGNWCDKELLQEERAVITQMINTKSFFCEEKGTKYYLVNNMIDDCAYIIVSDDDIKCFFLCDLPEALQARVKIENLHRFTEEEFAAIETLGRKVFIMKKPHFMPKDSTVFRRLAYARDLSNEEYSQFLFGIPYCSANTSVTDERIISCLQDNTYDGITFIPATPENQWIRSYIARSPYNTDEFIAFFGFNTRANDSDAALEFSEEEFRFVEDDMRAYGTGTDYIEKVFANSPLLGSHIITKKKLEILNLNSRKYIDKLLQESNLKPSLKAEMLITLAVINYAKGWDTEDESGFWRYITTSFGYRDESGQLRNLLCKCIYDALKKQQRWFITGSDGNHYKSSVVAHAFSTKRSWLYFCDFLFDFYKTNLEWEYIEDDPMIARMVLALRNKLQNTDNISDENLEISSKIYHFREGITKLIVHRPRYAAQLFARMIKRIDSLVNHTAPAATCYEEQLCDEWMTNKLRTISAPDKKDRSVERRTVAIDYTRIKPVYRLYNETNVQIVFPDVRLAENDFSSLLLTVYGKDCIIEQKNLRYYGNELGKTMSGFTLDLEDYLRRSGSTIIDPHLVITCDSKEIYNSESILFRRVLVFRDKIETDISRCEPGMCSVFVPQNNVIDFTDAEVASLKSNAYLKGYFVKLQKNFAIHLNGELEAFDNTDKCEGLRIVVTRSGIKADYVANGIRYNVVDGGESIHIISAGHESEKKFKLAVNSDIVDLRTLEHEEADDAVVYHLGIDQFGTDEVVLRLLDLSSDRLLLNRNFKIIRNLSYRFNRPYYFSAEDFREARMKIVVSGGVKEYPVIPGDPCISASYQNGELEIPVPVVRVIDNTDVEWNGTNRYWIKHIAQDRFLYLKAPAELRVDIQLGSQTLVQESQNAFALGNAVYGYSNTSDVDWLNLTLLVSQNGQEPQQYLIGRIAVKEQFVKKPKLKLDGSVLSWDRGYGFVGDTTSHFRLTICPDTEKEKSFELNLDEDIITEDLKLELGEYPFRISKQSGNIFVNQMVKLVSDTLFAGNADELRFLKHIIQIDSITFEDNKKYKSVKIRPCFIDHIVYKGIRYCGSEGRECPVYSGIMYFVSPNGKRHEYSFEDKCDDKGNQKYQINPVRIIYINDSTLSITHDTGDPEDPGDGFYYYNYFDKYAMVDVYQITDREPTKYNRDKYYLADLYAYRRKGV